MMLKHIPSGKKYEFITKARHVETGAILCIYRSVEASVDRETGQTLPIGFTWARDLREMDKKFKHYIQTEKNDK